MGPCHLIPQTARRPNHTCDLSSQTFQQLTTDLDSNSFPHVGHSRATAHATHDSPASWSLMHHCTCNKRLVSIHLDTHCRILRSFEGVRNLTKNTFEEVFVPPPPSFNVKKTSQTDNIKGMLVSKHLDTHCRILRSFEGVRNLTKNTFEEVFVPPPPSFNVKQTDNIKGMYCTQTPAFVKVRF